MKNENKIEYKYSNDTTFFSNYSYNPPCNCCNCKSSLCFCYCQCRCHKNKFKQNEEIDFENAPNLNINELKMNLLKDYSHQNNNNINNNFNPSLKNINLNSSYNILNNENIKNNGKNLFSLTNNLDNNFGKNNSSFVNQSQEVNYLNNKNNLKYYRNEKNDLLFKEVASHYKTQNNFNNLKKYYQLNNNFNGNKYDNISNNNTLKSQIEFNKLLNSIKGNDSNIINNNMSIEDINKKYNIFTEREARHYPNTNGYDIASIRSSNNSLAQDLQQLNNGLKNTFNFDRINKILEKSKEQNNKFNDFCSSTEYNKPFRSLKMNNGNILNLNERNININNNTSINISSDNYNNNSSKNTFIENNNLNQNGGNNYKDLISHSRRLSHNINSIKLEDDSITCNTTNLNKCYDKLMQNLDINSNEINHIKLSNTEPRYSNTSKNSENDNVNIKMNYLNTNISRNDNDNKNELLESKDINGDNNNNFIVTFGAKGNNEIKNIISSLKSEINSPNKNNNNNKNNGKGNENSDQKINNIIIDYENLKKRYEPNKLFTGLQNNIKDLNENINLNKNLNIETDKIGEIKTNNDINYTIYNFNIQIKGETNTTNENISQENENYKKEINNLNDELKESKNKIEELMNIINNYQKEINYLKEQMVRQSKRDSLMNESKNTINNINNISVSNNNINTSQKSCKTKIGKDSFIIKIPENLLRNNFNKERKSRNSTSNNRITTNNNNNNYSNISSNTSRNMHDRYIHLNNNNNYNNTSNQISYINNSNNSNCFTYNNVSSNNISNNSIINPNEIYVKKITTTMKKKIKKSASQKLRVNKIYNNLSLNVINQDIYIKNNEYTNRSNKIINDYNDKLIYTIFNNDNKIEIVSFDVSMKQFNIMKLYDYDNFMFNYSGSYNQQNNNILNNSSIFLLNDNAFYIVTGKNNDVLYKLNNNNNTMNMICKFKNNHAKGCLFYFEDKLFCLSGYHNRTFEMFSDIDNSLVSLEDMNIERSNFSVCVFKNKYIFALFGYNYPTHQCIDTIEFYDLKCISNYKNNNGNINKWRYLKYKNNNYLDLNIEGHICYNLNDEKIIFFGGFNGIKSEAIDCFYELVLDGDDFENEQSNKNAYVKKLNNNLNHMGQNKCYYFGNNNGLLLEDNNNIIFTAFDSNFHAHIIQTNNLSHNIYYFQ